MRDDIRSHLDLHQPYEVTTGFDRPNLYFETRRALPSQKPKELLDLVLREGDNAGIVYCSTTKQVDETARLLQSRGIRAAAYHAKLDAEVRRKNQDDFLYDRVQIMVATNAFGMGIDKPNVRFVIHYNMPKDLESYYQEAGRAGRDGLPSRCILLYSGTDVRTIRFFIDKEMEADNGLLADVKAEAARKAEERLKYMTFYSTTSKCLRRFMLNYFGEAAPEKCGNCSCCLFAEQNAQELEERAAAAKQRAAANSRRLSARRAAANTDFSEADEKLLAALYALRKRLAAKQNVPAYMVFSDATLRESQAGSKTNQRAHKIQSTWSHIDCKRGVIFSDFIKHVLPENAVHTGQSRNVCPMRSLSFPTGQTANDKAQADPHHAGEIQRGRRKAKQPQQAKKPQGKHRTKQEKEKQPPFPSIRIDYCAKERDRKAQPDDPMHPIPSFLLRLRRFFPFMLIIPSSH